MEMQKSRKCVGGDPLAQLRGCNTVVGAKQLRKALLNGKTSRVFLATNADPALTEPIEALCLKQSVDCVWVPSMLELGQACGIDVGAAAAAVIA